MNEGKGNPMKKWRCPCGYIHDGEAPPANCPKCGAPGERMAELDDKAAELVERSRHTNALHSQIVGLGREIERLCNAGIDDDLDPGCVDVFQKSRRRSYEIMKLSMTEMQSHMNKGKWG